ncbi:CvpA family protein [Anaerobacillus sp. MEB173]|uniref:CvpA family protein n=1 Tax=Anaerobacillus sp. MEB173 TaxID=3383345 RepID=UPI003F90EFDE
MVSLILLLILVGSFFIGLRRGFVLQLFHFLGFIASFVVAYMYFDDLAPHIRLWIPYPQLPSDSTVTMVAEMLNLESVYYSGIAFAILFIVTKIVMQIIGSMFDFLAHMPILRIVNGWLGGALGFIETYLVMFLLLHIAALIPLEFIQEHLHQSTLAKLIIDHTPILSDLLKDLWIGNEL